MKVYNLRNPEVLKQLREVIEEIMITITTTIGPTGSTVMLYDGDGTPHVTKDGVSVAEFLRYEDAFKESINRIIKETARSTGNKVGDGTTTSILLACNLILGIIDSDKEYEEVIEYIESDIQKVLEYVKEQVVSLDIFSDDTLKILENIAMISSNGDAEITKTIMEVVKQIGAEGLIDVTESLGEGTTVEIQDGMLIEAPAMVMRTYESIRPYVVLVSSPIEKVHEIKTLLNLSHSLYTQETATVILIADRFSEEVQNVVTINNRNGKLHLLLAESDGFGFSAYDIYDDMALLLDSKILSLDSSSPFSLQNVNMEHLVQVDRAILSPQQTVLYDKGFSRPEVQGQKADIMETIAALVADGGDKVGELRQLQKRLTKYAKSATIRIGGLTEAERREKMDRAEDAALAIHSAVNDGVVPGGGSVLYNAWNLTTCRLTQDWCSAPIEAMVEDSKKREEVLEAYRAGEVMDFRTWERGHFLALGVLDPAQALIKAIIQSLAVLKTVMGSRVLIVPEDGEI